MNTIHLDLKKIVDNSYDILISKGIFSDIPKDLESILSVSKYIIISDSNIYPIYGKKLENIFKESKLNVLSKIIPAGEESKSRLMKAEIEDFLIENNCDRNTCIIALGGGVIGDISGFIASTYMRGIPYIQIPTTLLAMADSSIGGKTAINIPAGKNLIGNFYQAKKVYIDISLLETLPIRQLKSGIAEIIKIAVIKDASLFKLLEENVDKILSKDLNIIKEIILKNASLKASIISEDEKESGIRSILNFGHNIGHAIESLMMPELTHGEAIAIGMIYEAKLSKHLSSEDSIRLYNCIKAYSLPLSIPKSLSKEDILNQILKDKKNLNGKSRYILLDSIGKVFKENFYTHEISKENLLSIL